MMGQIIEKSYDFIVVGGGKSGVCASIAAARKGVKTALIQNRPEWQVRNTECISVGLIIT